MYMVRLTKKVEFSLKNAQKLEFSGNPDEVGNPEKKFLLGDGPPHRVDHFELSYASLPQKLWPCSPNEQNPYHLLPYHMHSISLVGPD